jgi:hypothetical protein
MTMKMIVVAWVCVRLPRLHALMDSIVQPGAALADTSDDMLITYTWIGLLTLYGVYLYYEPKRKCAHTFRSLPPVAHIWPIPSNRHIAKYEAARQLAEEDAQLAASQE